MLVFDIFKLANNSMKLIKERDGEGEKGAYWEEWRNGVKREVEKERGRGKNYA